MGTSIEFDGGDNFELVILDPILKQMQGVLSGTLTFGRHVIRGEVWTFLGHSVLLGSSMREVDFLRKSGIEECSRTDAMS